MRTVMILLVILCGMPEAFNQNQTLSGLAPNTLKDLDSLKLLTPVGEGPGYYANGITDYGGMVYDPNNHQILIWGGGHATTMTDAVYAFSFQTLKWAALYSPTPSSQISSANLDSGLGALKSGPSGPYPRPLSRHSYDLLVVAPGRDELLMLREVGGPIGSYYPTGKAAHYDLVKNTWSFATGFSSGDDHAASEYDPVSGKVILLKQGGLWVYDPATKTGFKTTVGTSGLDYADQLVYFPPNQKMYYFLNASVVWEVALNRMDFNKSTVVQLSTSGSQPPSGEKGFDYDSANKIIGGGVTNNIFYAFDPVTRAWSSKTMQGGSPGSMEFHCIAYDPVDNAFIFIAGSSWWTRKSWAYRWAGGAPQAVASSLPGTGNAPGLDIFPNPAVTQTRVRLDTPGSNGAAVIGLYDMRGREVRSFKTAGGDMRNNGMALDVREFAAGVYLLKASHGNKTYSAALFINR